MVEWVGCRIPACRSFWQREWARVRVRVVLAAEEFNQPRIVSESWRSILRSDDSCRGPAERLRLGGEDVFVDEEAHRADCSQFDYFGGHRSAGARRQFPDG